MRSITRFGTYGFLALLLSAQTASTALGSDKSDRTLVDVKKSGRSIKRDVKKAGRKLTGKQSKWEDFKDSAHDAKDNTKDEVNHQVKKAKKK